MVKEAKELQNEFPEVLGRENPPNILGPESEQGRVQFWQGWSEAAFEVVLELRRLGKIKFTPATPRTYMLDGGGMDLPLALGTPGESNYKTPHWAPVALCRNPKQQPQPIKADKEPPRQKRESRRKI